MNYQKIYDQLIEKRRRFPLTKNKKDPNYIYCEAHHIIPRCLNGSDDPNNIVNLTAREHFIAHYLLWKIHPCDGTLLAFCMFKKGNPHSCAKRNFKNSRLYASARIAFNEWNVRAHSGIKQTPERIQHRVEKLRGQKRTEEQKRHISEGRLKSSKCRGHIPWNKGLQSEITIKKQNEKRIKMEQRIVRHNEILEKLHQKEIQKQIRLKRQKEKEQYKKDRHERFLLLTEQRKQKQKIRNEMLIQSKLKWWNNGIQNTRSYSCPGKDWKRGKIRPLK